MIAVPLVDHGRVIIQPLTRSVNIQSPQDQSESYQEMSQMLYETQRIHGNLVQLLTLYKFGNNLYPCIS